MAGLGWVGLNWIGLDLGWLRVRIRLRVKFKV